MARYLETSGKSSLAIGVCGRCGIKMPIGELMPDPNAPGLRVCRDDLDQLDPWRLSPRAPDNLVVQYARPDLPLSDGPKTWPIPLNVPVPIPLTTEGGQLLVTTDGLFITSDRSTALQLVTLLPPVVWMPGTPYSIGSQVTPPSVPDAITCVFVCVATGMSGATSPAWTSTQGTFVIDENGFNTVVWFNIGINMP